MNLLGLCCGIPLVFLFLFLGVLPLFVMAFWGMVAYIHVFFILLVPLFLMMCITFVIWLACGELSKREQEKAKSTRGEGTEEAARVRERERKRRGGGIAEGTARFLLVPATVALVYVFQIFVGLFAATAMLYWHGDYMKFHGAFFDQFSSPTFVFPSFSRIFIMDWEFTKWLWENFLTFELALPLQFVYGISILTQAVCAILVFATGLVRFLREERRPFA
mmetsp:Transcript_82632/g.164088  ORF Transcript_82632/g.164088 Transcript_82632/m.164088 type:complete len:220 (-) Transcript_82632:62-721(-)